ncbi:MAG: class I SAM-dependent methyltransferase [Phycisphaerales bacterium]|nr:class I SAM-dependent methyltransferase [Phycisphaerales bacterium]
MSSSNSRTRRVAYPEIAFGGVSRVDTTVAFYGRLQALLKSTDAVLDVGCGRGAFRDEVSPDDMRHQLRDLKPHVHSMTGIDVDPDAAVNSGLDEFHLIDDINRWPVEDERFDVVMSDYVLEHVEHPTAFFAEVSRVLKPGGLLALRTPNKWSYVSVAARLIPNRMHSNVTSAVQSDRQPEDVFPVYYRCNTRRSIRRYMEGAGFDSAIWRLEGEPAYLAFNSLLYRSAAVAHRLLPGFIQTTLLAFGRKG